MRFKSHLRNQRLVFTSLLFLPFGKKSAVGGVEHHHLCSMVRAFKHKRRMRRDPLRLWRNIASAKKWRVILDTSVLIAAFKFAPQITQIKHLFIKSHLRNQKRFHSRYNFGYGILLYIRKMPCFRPFTAHFGGFKGGFSYINDKSAMLCPGKTEVADFVSFKGSIVQGMILLDKLEFDD